MWTTSRASCRSSAFRRACRDRRPGRRPCRRLDRDDDGRRMPAMASSTELSTTSQTRWCKPALIGRADVHPGALSDRLETLENLDALSGVVRRLAGSAGGTHSSSPPRSRGPSSEALVETAEFLVAVELDHDAATSPGSARLTFVPSARRRSSSTRSRSGSRAGRVVGRVPFAFGSRSRRTGSSVWRTERSWSTTAPRTCSWCSTEAHRARDRVLR